MSNEKPNALRPNVQTDILHRQRFYLLHVQTHMHINKRTRHISSHEVDVFIPNTYRLQYQLLCSCRQVSSWLHQDKMYDFTLLKNN